MFKLTYRKVFLNPLTLHWASFALTDLLTRQNQENVSTEVESVRTFMGWLVAKVTKDLLSLASGAGLGIMLVSVTGNVTQGQVGDVRTSRPQTSNSALGLSKINESLPASA